MNYLSQYTIPFSGLKEGKHLFEFTADYRFFAGFEQSEIEKGNLSVQIELEKRSTYMGLAFIIKGEVELICDRCLENYMQPLKSRNTLLVKFSEETIEEDAEIIYIHPTEHQIELAQLIYEFIVLSLPIRHVHPDDNDGNSLCDPSMLKKLDEYRAFVSGKDEPEDPRWNELRKIIGN
jgi:uncharacterized protein